MRCSRMNMQVAGFLEEPCRRIGLEPEAKDLSQDLFPHSLYPHRKSKMDHEDNFIDDKLIFGN